MAGQVSQATRIQMRARERVMASLAKAKARYANIPLGETRYDPRTEKKRAQEGQLDPGMDTTLKRLLHELRNGQ